MDPESEGLRLTKTRLGRKCQAGGGIAAFIGVLLVMATPPAPPGSPMNIHQFPIVY